MGVSPFEVFYWTNSHGPLNLVPITITKWFSSDAEVRAMEIQKMDADIWVKIEKSYQKYKGKANKYRRQVSFKEGDFYKLIFARHAFLMGAMISSSFELVVLFEFLRGLEKILSKMTCLMSMVFWLHLIFLTLPLIM